ncbi:MAG TPA: sodium:alanine symporter family protein, partial [Flavobacteriia bacterium]|nr:sodium:alanine symporter family protein [Flavobacteriia bacterium]
MNLKQKNYLLIILITLWPFLINAQSKGLDEQINDAFMPFAIWWENFIFTQVIIGGVGIPVVLILLLFGASFFTVYFKFVNIRHFVTAIKVVRGNYDSLEETTPIVKPHVFEVDGDLVDTIKDESHHGEVNHFQALATAVSGTVGLGNIAMVAVAISIGGPGATFWMVIA